ncbi:MAG: transcriptional regulator [Chloroflexota bacterium]|nr:transcriptional regulator [Chloroflexota bacterium]MDE2960364.1 transcriptional regulator [Chloroflexota bacterium]
MCNIKPVRTEEQYEAALARIEILMDAEPNTPEDEELDLLVDLVLLYEYRNIPMPVPEGRALIRFWVEERGWTVQSINELLEGNGDIEELLAGEQEMTPAMAETLHLHLRIPVAELLRVANTPTPPGVIPPLSTVARVADLARQIPG